MFYVFLAGSCAAPTTVAFYRYFHLLPRVVDSLLSPARGSGNIQELTNITPESVLMPGLSHTLL